MVWTINRKMVASIGTAERTNVPVGENDDYYSFGQVVYLTGVKYSNLELRKHNKAGGRHLEITR